MRDICGMDRRTDRSTLCPTAGATKVADRNSGDEARGDRLDE